MVIWMILRCRLMFIAKNPDDIFALRKAIFTALETAFDYAERESDFSDYEPDTKLHRRVITYQIAYGE